jgi:hypothetical protein
MIGGLGRRTSLALSLAMGVGLSNLGGSCGSGSGNGGGKDAAAEAATVAATCAGVCQCLAAACPDYPFAPDCVTACQDPTNNPPWDLSCRARECSAAYTGHDAHCPNASGQATCH